MFLSKSIPPFRCQGNGADFHIAVRSVRPETVSVICVRSGAPSIISAKLLGTPRCGVCVCVRVRVCVCVTFVYYKVEFVNLCCSLEL